MSRYIYINNLTKKLDMPARVQYADEFMSKLRGLMFRPRLEPDFGLLLVGDKDSRLDSSIHMFFVSFDLAVFWINSDMQIVDKVIAKSWKPAYFPKADAKYTLEIHPNRFNDYEIGDKVEFVNA
ncbi:MAG: hypothetical protein UZ14_CFX002002059 [Chloroflexi bacterium OLB14]|nr:MAG: hypothetical protein UZ14_CFX002002059 [Chloroflexi bacterium OLB14]